MLLKCIAGMAPKVEHTISASCADTGQHLLQGSFCQLHGRRCGRAWLHAVLGTCMHASNYSIYHRPSRCKHSPLHRLQCKINCMIALSHTS